MFKKFANLFSTIHLIRDKNNPLKSYQQFVSVFHTGKHLLFSKKEISSTQIEVKWRMIIIMI